MVEDGTLEWATETGGSGTRVAAGGAGFAFVTGAFVGTVVLGAGQPNETTLVSASNWSQEIFLARYDRDGSLVWARRDAGPGAGAAGGETAEPRAITTSADDGAVIAGRFLGEVVFGADEPGSTALTAVPCGPEVCDASDAFAASYRADDGVLVWAQSYGGAGASGDVVDAVVTTADALMIAGRASDGARFGRGAGAITITSAGYGDAFVARFEE